VYISVKERIQETIILRRLRLSTRHLARPLSRISNNPYKPARRDPILDLRRERAKPPCLDREGGRERDHAVVAGETGADDLNRVCHRNYVGHLLKD